MQAMAVEKGQLEKTKELKTFLELLPYVLPCKYCRSSLKQYLKEVTLQEAWDSKKKEAISKWIFKIHNKVNDKLRSQGLLHCENPPYETVRQKYKKWMKDPLTEHTVLGFDFLKSVAYTTPLANHDVLRSMYLERWWSTIEFVLPFLSWRIGWRLAIKKEGNPPLEKGKHAMLSWIYRIYKYVNNIQESHFKEFSMETKAFASSCKTGKTCRVTKMKNRKTIKKHRSRTLRQFGGFL